MLLELKPDVQNLHMPLGASHYVTGSGGLQAGGAGVAAHAVHGATTSNGQLS